ncbi:MAG: hypothetical protein JXQ23_01780 [Clostridia bacterium]|nr:hypothetical protein [Clostridia bacterium]
MRVETCKIGYVKEKLIKPFGFKGGYVSDVWQVAVTIGDSECQATGLSIQSVLWSDAFVFQKYGQEKGDQLMYDTTKYALGLLKTIEFDTPFEVTARLFELCYKHITEMTKENIRKTFVLNALVAVDMAIWLFYARKNNITSFSALTSLEKEHDKIASIPLITYTTTTEEIKNILTNGEFFLKVKIGNENEWDKKRVKEIFELTKGYHSEYTSTKRPVLYLDANGRYESKGQLLSLIEYLDKERILSEIGVFEEPFSEDKQFDVSDIPCLFACDESAHSVHEVKERFQQGYRSLALKPVAKTLSESLVMLSYANEMNMKTFIADLTVNPVLLELNRNVAARIKTLDCVSVGLLETNGEMNYSQWNQMVGYHPLGKKGFLTASEGVFDLKGYYMNDGGFFMESDYYNKLPSEVI